MRFRRPDPSWRKTLAFGVIHLFIAVSVGWLFTGSFVLAGVLSLAEPALNTLAHHGLDRWWARHGAGGRHAALLETLVFGLTHLVIAAGLGWWLTGSWVLAGAYALVEPAANAVAHFFFERAWARRAAELPSELAPAG